MRVMGTVLAATLAFGAQQTQQAAAAAAAGAAAIRAAAPATQQPEVVQTAPRESNDPRVTLKPGLTNAGVAAKNIELVATMPKPAELPAEGGAAGAVRRHGTANGGRASVASSLDFANSDLAFRRADMFLGNFNGFNIYDIETPKKPRVLRVDRLPRRPGGHVGVRQPARRYSA